MQRKESRTVIQDNIRFSDEDFKVRITPGKSSVSNAPELFHPEIEIKFFYSGEAWLLIGEDNVHATAGDIVIINPYEIHSTVRVGDDPGKYLLLIVDLNFFSTEMSGELDLFHRLLSKQLRFNHLIRNNEDMNALLTLLAKETDPEKPCYRATVRGLLLAFFALLFRDEVSPLSPLPGNSKSEKYYSVIEPALKKIRSDYPSPLTVNQLAELCNISTSHFCRIFKLVTGQTVIHYITDYRLKIAKLMLEHSNSTLAQITDSCGFQEEGYFGRCYKRKYHRTPRQERMNASKNEEA